jgi:dihydroorotase
MSEETITIPGAVDLHVHLREPGDNKSETIASGTKAAHAGGYVLVCDMPNNPGRPTWTHQRVKEKKEIIDKTAQIQVMIYAGAQPESDNLTELPKMAQQCVGLKLYGAPTTGNENDYKAEQFEEIIKIWHESAPRKPIMLHAGADNLEPFIELIANKYKHPLHICHVHSVSDVKLVQKAKTKKLAVTCGVCPHHLFMTSHDERTRGWFARMKPPLTMQTEVEQLFDYLVEGQIDVLETDHAPHSEETKWQIENDNPHGIHEGHKTCYGVPGIEFALPLLFYQMKCGRISLDRIIEITSAKPIEIIGVKLPSKKVSWKMTEYRISGADVVSGSGWTPYEGMIAVGKVA